MGRSEIWKKERKKERELQLDRSRPFALQTERAKRRVTVPLRPVSHNGNEPLITFQSRWRNSLLTHELDRADLNWPRRFSWVACGRGGGGGGRGGEYYTSGTPVNFLSMIPSPFLSICSLTKDVSSLYCCGLSKRKKNGWKFRPDQLIFLSHFRMLKKIESK